jgi:hypothetical protein
MINTKFNNVPIYKCEHRDEVALYSHNNTKNGEPACFELKDGGEDKESHYFLAMQNGVFSKNGLKGYNESDLLRIVKHRIEFFQNGDFPCADNIKIINAVSDALAAIEERIQDRKSRNVHSKNEA